MSVPLQFATQRRDLGSAAIHAFQHGFWATHVDTVMPDGQLLGARYEGGVAVRPVGYANFASTQVVVLPLDTTTTNAYMDFVTDQVGKPYDRTAIEGFALGRDWQDPDSWFCSELVCAGLIAARAFPHPYPTGASKCTPADLYLAISMMTDTSGGPSG